MTQNHTKPAISHTWHLTDIQTHTHTSPSHKQGDTMTPSHSKELPGSILQLHCCKLLSLHHPLSHTVTARCLFDSFKMSPTSRSKWNPMERCRYFLTDFLVSVTHTKLSISAREWLNQGTKTEKLNNSSVCTSLSDVSRGASKAWKSAGSCGGVSLERLFRKPAFQLPFVPHNFSAFQKGKKNSFEMLLINYSAMQQAVNDSDTETPLC